MNVRDTQIFLIFQPTHLPSQTCDDAVTERCELDLHYYISLEIGNIEIEIFFLVKNHYINKE